jgi:hypothetical protein
MLKCWEMVEKFNYRYSFNSSDQINKKLLEKINQYIRDDLFSECELTEVPWITSEMVEKKIK